ncbi:hypothetical protein [Arenibaculum pallidiluteum]|uniref:hypothetical protein n=1 Tax=Arenibaculum pallidiluteum TaxID=2812559 RepID=UPI001A9580BC|nr:hypothetical protein [Arenibaculum pallidiluteum]
MPSPREIAANLIEDLRPEFGAFAWLRRGGRLSEVLEETAFTASSLAELNRVLEPLERRLGDPELRELHYVRAGELTERDARLAAAQRRRARAAEVVRRDPAAWSLAVKRQLGDAVVAALPPKIQSRGLER